MNATRRTSVFRLRWPSDRRPEIIARNVRRAECIVLYAFTIEARIDPRFTELAAHVAAETRAFIRKIMVEAQVAEADAETDRLAALIDGLTFRAIYLDDVIDADRIRGIVAAILTPCSHRVETLVDDRVHCSLTGLPAKTAVRRARQRCG